MSAYLLPPDKELLVQTDSEHAVICTLIQMFFFKVTSLLSVFPASPHRTWKEHLPYHISCTPAFWENQGWLFRRYTVTKSVSSVNVIVIFPKQKEPQACKHRGECGSLFWGHAAHCGHFYSKTIAAGIMPQLDYYFSNNLPKSDFAYLVFGAFFSFTKITQILVSVCRERQHGKYLAKPLKVNRNMGSGPQ